MLPVWLPAFGILIVPVARGESSSGVLPYFPLVDLRQFYNTSRYIWTISTTLQNVFCKVDNPMYETHKEVYFLRNTTDTGLNQKPSEPLRGSFYDLNPWFGPTMMQVSNEVKSDYTEQLVYRDKRNMCGVFLTLQITPIDDQHFRRNDSVLVPKIRVFFSPRPLCILVEYSRSHCTVVKTVNNNKEADTYYSYYSCELRVKGTICGPKNTTTACDAAFQDLCGRNNNTYTAYNSSCLIKKS